ncbi:hypothetical protein ABPG73_007721 [Tetrahymena malaccensis]
MIQALKYSYADDDGCKVAFQVFVGANRQCLMNNRVTFIQSDLDQISKYFVNTNCLTPTVSIDNLYYLTGDNCKSNSEQIFQYDASPQKVQDVYFQMQLVVKNSQDPNLQPILIINSKAQEVEKGYTDFYQNTYSSNFITKFQTVKSNLVTIQVTPIPYATYQTYIYSISLAVSLYKLLIKIHQSQTLN